MIPDRNKAKEILKKHIKEKPNLEHCLLTGYCMHGVAKKLGKEEKEQEKYLITGILHDIDIESYGEDMKNHCLKAEEILKEYQIDQEIIENIKSHNPYLEIKREKEIEHVLFSCDGLSGIIRAYVLMREDRDVQKTKLKSIKKKIKDKTFAKGVDRQEIFEITKHLDLSLDEFIESSIKGVKENIDFEF